MASRPNLKNLAARLGILPSYVDQVGTTRQTTDAAREELLAAMGIDASSEAKAAESLQREQRRASECLLAPVRVVTQAPPRRVLVRSPALAERGGPVEWELLLRQEGGQEYRARGVSKSGRGGTFDASLPRIPGQGYHSVEITASFAGGREATATQRLIVTPSHCPAPEQLLPRGSAFGILANLYTLRSERNGGVGDLSDLRQLVSWAGRVGADFVGFNPLHALGNRNGDISPYSPLSRLFRNLLYLDVGAVPELRHAPAVQRRLDSPRGRRRLAALRAADLIDYDAVLDAKLPLLRQLHRVFSAARARGETSRGRAYRRYLERNGEALQNFATFLALRDHFGEGRDWRAWPQSHRHPDSVAVQAFRTERRREIDFYCYVQFELDRQLARAAQEGRRSGMRLGLYQDLAIGCSPSGGDTWMFPNLFLQGVGIGAPPDAFYSEGQSWGLPPVDPRRLAQQGYAYWIQLVRGALAHAGALRIDHVMGLFRQFWIPSGRTGRDGAYVRFPAPELLAILALESTRAHALVVGEDLGTVPRGLPSVLKRWGVLSTRVLYFERGSRGEFRPARKYRRHALASANTHDMVPLDGFWRGRDLEIRRDVGIISSDAELEAAREERRRDRRQLLRCLAAEGVLPSAKDPGPTLELRRAVHSFLRRSPAALVGLSLDDLTGETDPVNVPSLGLDRYPCWSRKMRLALERIRRDPDVRAALGDAGKQVR